MGTIRIAYSPKTVIIGTIVVVAAYIAALFLSLPAILLAGIAAVAAVLCSLTVRGSSLWSTFARRAHVADPYRPVHIGVLDKAAALWDGTSATVYVEVMPKDDFAVTFVDAHEEISREPIDLRLLERLMVQNDIALKHITVISAGYRNAIPNLRAGSLISEVTGSTPLSTGGSTYLAITLDTDQSHAAIGARAIKGSVPFGINKSVMAAAARIRILIEGQGISARVLTPRQVGKLTDAVYDQVGLASDHASWDRLGKGDAAAVVTYTPSKATRDDQRAWLQTPAHRTFETTRLTRTESGEVVTDYTVTYVVFDESALHDIGSYGGLRRTNGQHKQIVSRLLPLVADEPVHLPQLAMAGRDESGLAQYPGGIGVFLGTHAEKGRMFMRMRSNSGEALHLIGPDILAQMVVLRMCVGETTVDVRLTDDPHRAHAWQQFINQIASPLITFNSRRSADVIVVPDGHRQSGPRTDQTVIVASTRTPAVPPHTTVVAKGSELVITSGSRQTTIPWSMNHAERAYLVTAEEPARHAAP